MAPNLFILSYVTLITGLTAKALDTVMELIRRAELDLVLSELMEPFEISERKLVMDVGMLFKVQLDRKLEPKLKSEVVTTKMLIQRGLQGIYGVLKTE